LKDSAQVASYFTQYQAHCLFEEEFDEDESIHNSDNDDTYEKDARKRKKKEKVLLLPAGLRLGKILIIVQLNANPTDLPLPTLSKVSIKNMYLFFCTKSISSYLILLTLTVTGTSSNE
jgi:hypothetical protein